MADNAVPWAFDDIDGEIHPRVKPEHGPNGAATDVSQTSPLPVHMVQRTDAVYVGSLSTTPVHVLVSASSSTTSTIVAAQSSARVRVIDYVLNAHATTSVSFGSSTTPITGTLVIERAAVSGLNPFGHFESGVNQPLTIINGGGGVRGHLVCLYVSPGLFAFLPTTLSCTADATSGSATVTLTIGTTGGWSITPTPSGSGADSGIWHTGPGPASDYAVRLTIVSGTVTSGPAMATSHNLSTTRTWTVSQSTNGSKVFEGTLEIRAAHNDAVLDSCAVTMTANFDDTIPP